MKTHHITLKPDGGELVTDHPPRSVAAIDQMAKASRVRIINQNGHRYAQLGELCVLDIKPEAGRGPYFIISDYITDELKRSDAIAERARQIRHRLRLSSHD